MWDKLLLINPRAVAMSTRRKTRRKAARRAMRGPRRLSNLPPALRRYWQRVRGTTRRVANPRTSRGTHMATRRRRKRHSLTRHQVRVRAGRKAARTRARRRYVANPRRSARHHVYRARRRRLSNPRRLGGGFSRRGIVSMATGAGVGMIGAVGLDYLWQYASGYLPANLQTGYVGTFAKAAVAVGAGWLAGKVINRQTAIAGTVGALTVIGYQLLHQMIASAAPAAAIPATTTAATPAVAGMGAYMRPAMGGLGWVSPGSPLRGLNRVGAYMPHSRIPVTPVTMPKPGGSVSVSGLAMAGGY